MTAPHTVAGHTAGIAGADEKNASLTMKLVAKSGYRSQVKVPAISPNQWGALIAICEGKDACTRMLASADLLASLIELLEPLERASAAMVADGKALNEAGEAAFDRARAAIAKATAARQSNDIEGEAGRG